MLALLVLAVIAVLIAAAVVYAAYLDYLDRPLPAHYMKLSESLLLAPMPR